MVELTQFKEGYFVYLAYLGVSIILFLKTYEFFN